MFKKCVVFGFAALVAVASSGLAQTLDEIIEKRIKAHGGIDKIKGVQSMRMKGKSQMEGIEAPFLLELKRPGKLRMEVTIQGMTLIQAFDGVTGWQVIPFMGSKDPQKMPEDELKSVKEQADMDGPLVEYKLKGHTVELMGKEDVEGAEAFKLKVTLKDGDIRYVYIDPETFLEIKVGAKIKREGSEMEAETTLSSYKDVGGLMLPHSIESKLKGQPGGQVIVVESIELNVPIDDSIFVMPPPAPPAPSK